MRVLRNLLVMGGLSISFALPQLVLCADATSNDGPVAQDKAQIDETKHHDRGFAFTPLNETSGVQAPVMTIPTKRTVLKKATETLPSKNTQDKKVVNIQAKPRKPLITTAAQKAKQDLGMTTITATSKSITKSTSITKALTPAEQFKTESIKPLQSINSPNMLVKYSQTENVSVISATLDRRGTLPTYKVGENMVVNVRANQDCNVVVFNYDSTGTLTQIFPNDFQQNGFVKAGDTVQIGGAESPFDYQIAGKGGQEKIFVYAYPTDGDFKSPMTAMGKSTSQVAMAPISGTPFRGAEMTVDEYRKMVNSSQVFFSRSVLVKPRSPHSAQLVSSSISASSPNKVELTFSVAK